MRGNEMQVIPSGPRARRCLFMMIVKILTAAF